MYFEQQQKKKKFTNEHILFEKILLKRMTMIINICKITFYANLSGYHSISS